jgi:hypothetical protein
MSAQPDPHAELGVPPGATHAEIHRAFRRRLRENHPDTRSQQDDTADPASDQALRRVLAAYESLRHQEASTALEAPTNGQPRRLDQRVPVIPSWSPGDPPFRATAVHWVPAAGPGPSHYPARVRTSHGVPRPDWLIRWLLGD